MNRRMLTKALGICATVALLLGGCSAADSGSEHADGATTVHSALIADPTTFDPSKSAGTDPWLMRLMYDSLLRRDGDGVTAGLATSWQAIDTQTYSFQLRDGATCADGSSITPTVVKGSLDYFAANGTGWPALVFGPKKPTIDADDSSSTVTVHLAAPWVDLLQGLTLAQTGIICGAGVADPAALGRGQVPGAFSGPYTPTRVEPGVGYTFALRDGYDAWPQFAVQAEGAPPAQIDYSITSDQSTLANQLITGDLDFGPVYGAEAMGRFDGLDGFGKTSITQGTTYLVFNERDSSVFHDNQPLRTAVAQAIDREGYNTAVSGGRAQLLNSVVTSQIQCASDDASLLPTHDTAAAEPLLKGVKIRMIGSNAIGSNGSASTFVQESLQALGAEVQLNLTDNATWSTNLRAVGDWDLTVLGDLNAIGTVSSSLTRNVGAGVDHGGRNYSGSDNPEGVAAMAAAAATTDPDQQCSAFRDAQKSVLQRVDAFPLASLVVDWVSREGFSAQVYGDAIDLSTLRVTEGR